MNLNYWKHNYIIPSLLTESALSFKQLGKSPKRFENFITKIEEELPFETVDGDMIVLDKHLLQRSDILPKLKVMRDKGEVSTEYARQLFGTSNVWFPIKDSDREINLSQLKKTHEFGGKGSTFFVKKEEEARGQLQDLIDKTLDKSKESSLTVKIQDKNGKTIIEYDDITGIETQNKIGGLDPKADFVLVRKKKPSVFISHKDGSKPNDFGQWGGVSAKAGDDIYNHPEVRDFVKTLKESEYVEIDANGNYSLKPGLTVGRKINKPELKLLGVFGKEYEPYGPGAPENVDLVAQGHFNLTLDETDGKYILKANHMMVRQDFDGDFGIGYEPILIARFATERMNHGIKGARISIYPIAGRKVSAYI